jgi:hypothetical protein
LRGPKGDDDGWTQPGELMAIGQWRSAAAMTPVQPFRSIGQVGKKEERHGGDPRNDSISPLESVYSIRAMKVFRPPATAIFWVIWSLARRGAAGTLDLRWARVNGGYSHPLPSARIYTVHRANPPAWRPVNFAWMRSF